jgi:hypothetical protein
VLQHAVDRIAQELVGCSAIYTRAIMHYIEKSIRSHIVEVLRSESMQPEIDSWLANSSATAAVSEGATFLSYVSFLKDFDLAKRLWDDWRNNRSFQKYLSIVEVDGCIYIATDFVTGMIDLNRFLFKKKISEEERRKLLFGFDQILS